MNAIKGVFKQQPEDFRVDEVLGFEPTGRGEHLLLEVEKRGMNTRDAARRIARLLSLPEKQVGYCGLKDRHGVTRQWFSAPFPGQGLPDRELVADDRFRVVTVARHHRKLRRGAHRGNRFEIRIRDVTGSRDLADSRLRETAANGVPNFFGPQRFGSSNLAQADQLFRGGLARLTRIGRGLLISAARSAIFNEVLDRRVRERSWNTLCPGEAAVLDGSSSYFRIGDVDDELRRRCAELDVHPSGPLYGAGENPASGQVGRLEAAVFEAFPLRCEGLRRCGLRMERRALRLRVSGLAWEWLDADGLLLKFDLPRGGYATSVLQHLGQVELPGRKEYSCDQPGQEYK